MRDRLIELLEKGNEIFMNGEGEHSDLLEQLADHLLAAGVIVPPCKVGDTVYRVHSDKTHCARKYRVVPVTVHYITIDAKGISVKCLEYSNPLYFGDRIFLTKEEAERALAERREG
jgi:precorrin-6B methylase 2